MQASKVHLWTKASISELNLHFDEVIKGFGFIQNTEESFIYKKISGSLVAFLVLYVDDILLIGNDVQMLNSVKEYLNSKF
jgi:hypothetical protein